MSRLPFWKVQSIGNDFPLIHASDVQTISEATGASTEFLVASLAVQMADRHFGVGGDGLLVLAREDGVLRLRMFNPDGTEDFCGNGLRAAALHAHGLGWLGFDGSVRHLDQEVAVKIRDGVISTVIGSASYDPERVPTSGVGELFNQTIWSGMDAGMPLSIPGSALTTGSTHVVIPTYALPDDDTFRSVSAKIEVDKMYPERTSVIWVQELEPMKLKIRIWERGVGETFGCGTGSSAAAANYLRQKSRGGTVTVENPGGSIEVSMERWDSPITISGKAEEVYSGEFVMPDTM
jgi:diaminopimelate epimerase